MNELSIEHNSPAKRFEYHEGNETAYVEYALHNHTIIFLHTVVPPELGGRGIAAALAAYAFSYAKEQALPVVVRCPYIENYLKKHPELSDQLADPFNSNA